MRIAIGADHGGFELKENVCEWLKERNIEYEDFGTYGPESVDYPEYGKKVGLEVISGRFDRGIVICGTGIGISISCNKVPGIRCALATDVFSAKASRAHNNAQVLAMGGRVLGIGPAKEILNAWLDTEFEGGRHERRVQKIGQIEKECSSL